jgi:transcriptional regulator with XRE-family HTH domain/tetratricopeptide (TPR) repeat protein
VTASSRPDDYTPADLRRHAHLTQEQLAERSGVAVRTIRGLERGVVAQPRWATVVLLARSLGTTESEVVSALKAVREIDAGFTAHSHRLPTAVGDLTGRATLMATVREMLVPSGLEQVGSCRVVNLSGRPGVGKSCLATALAHSLVEVFPGGVLWSELRGSSATPGRPAAVLDDLLTALGLPVDRTPETPSERASAFETLTAARRVMLVLDDAADEDQVSSLLPRVPSVALVTSRRPLAGIAGVHGVDVDILSQDASVELLASIIGPSRAAAEPDEVDRIASVCAGLPLALRIAGARLVARPTLPVGSLAQTFADERQRLGELRYADLDVLAPLQLALQSLGPANRQGFGLLGRVDAPSLSEAAAQAVLGTDPVAARAVLDRLVDARLLDVTSDPRSREARYGFHDLIRLFARQAPVQAVTWRDALSRLGSRMLAMAELADGALPVTSDVIIRGDTPRLPPEPKVEASIRADPLTWFRTEESALEGVVYQLLHAGLVEPAWELASQVRTYGLLHGRHDVWSSTHEAALLSCLRVQDTRGAASMRFGLGKLRHEQHRRDAIEPAELLAAATACREVGDLAAESRAIGEAASWYGWIGRFDLAEQHGQQSLDLARRCESDEILADALFVLGRIRLRQDLLESAADLLDEARQVCDRLGKPRSQGQVLWQLGVVHARLGDFLRGRAHLLAVVAVVRSVGDDRGEARILVELADLCLDAGWTDEASDWVTQALDATNRAQTPHFRAMALMSQARLQQHRSQLDQAAVSLTAAYELWQDMGDTRNAEQVAERQAHLRARTPAR